MLYQPDEYGLSFVKRYAGRDGIHKLSLSYGKVGSRILLWLNGYMKSDMQLPVAGRKGAPVHFCLAKWQYS